MAAASAAALIHSLLAAGTFVLFYFAFKYAKKYYYVAAFLLPPFVCVCMIYENIVRAATNLDANITSVYDVHVDKNLTSVQVMLALQSCIIPLMLLICFEVTYLVHKTKSVDFCGISFESGHRANRNNLKSTFLRFAVWLVGLSLLLLNLYVYYHYFPQIEFRDGSYWIGGDATVSTILTVIPAYVLVVLAMYMGLRLWNYGCNYAFVIHATCFNPWIWMVVGAVALTAGYLVPGPVFNVTSNVGEFIMLAAIVRMFREVHHDLQQVGDFAPVMDRSLRDPPSTIVPSAPSASISSPTSDGTYVAMHTPRHHGADDDEDDAAREGERLTDASTNAYFSELLARTKDESRPRRAEPMPLDPVRLQKPQRSGAPEKIVPRDDLEDITAELRPATFEARFEPMDPWVVVAKDAPFPVFPDEAVTQDVWKTEPPRALRRESSESVVHVAGEHEDEDDEEDVVLEAFVTPMAYSTADLARIDDDANESDWLASLGASLDFDDAPEPAKTPEERTEPVQEVQVKPLGGLEALVPLEPTSDPVAVVEPLGGLEAPVPQDPTSEPMAESVAPVEVSELTQETQ